jgi:FkbM family methyltransferase
VASSFRQLRDAVGAEARIQCFQTALGRDEGTARMVVEGRSDMSYLARDANPSAAEGSIEVICVTSLDAFCQRHGIGRINYLKVDVEGAEMDVLEGGRGMLEDQRVDLIELEAGMRSTSRRHTPWGALQGFLEPRGYLLFGVYEQVTEWPTRRPELRRANLAFISEAVAEANRSPT